MQPPTKTVLPSPKPEEPGPRRTCVGCRRTRPQHELLRVARTSEGTLRVGRTLAGRGAWLCQDSPGCFDVAARRGGFARAFRTPIGAEAIAQLEAELGADRG